MRKKPKIYEIIEWIVGIFIGGLLVKLIDFVLNKKKVIKENFEDFKKEEKKEAVKLITGKEDLNQYCHDSLCLIKDYFIPYEGNDHKPKILHSNSLIIIAVVLILIKVAITGYLFFIYPNQAKMADIMTMNVLELTNKDRAANDVKALSLNPVLSASAKAKAENMIANNYFAHYSPTGVKPWDFINRNEYPYLIVGENLAMNFSTADSAQAALMQSPTHKKNILNENYTDIGLAVVSGEIDGKITNILVELFATKKETVVVSIKTPEAKEEAVVKTIAVAKEAPTSTVPVKEKTVPVIKKAEVISTPKPTSTKPAVIPVKPIIEPKKELATSTTPLETPEDTSFLALSTTTVTSTVEMIAPDISLVLEEENENATDEIATSSLELEIESNFATNTAITYFKPEADSQFRAAAVLIKVSKFIYLSVLVLMIIALLLNIFIRITIQHRPVIIQTLVLIIFISGLVSIHLNFLENVAGWILVV